MAKGNFNMTKGANDFSLEDLDELFNGEGEQETPPATEGTGSTETPPATENKQDVTQTQAFAHRLKEEKEKARKEARDEIAAALGYQSYEDLQKSRENKLLEDKGLDPEQVNPIVDELVKQRLDNDPRMKELESLKQQQVKAFAEKELKEISSLTGEQYTSLDQLPKDVIDDWRTSGSLKSSYIKLHGEELIIKARKAQTKGGTSHLQDTAGSAPTPTDTRPMTDKEKAIYKFFNPGIKDEELDKKLYKK